MTQDFLGSKKNLIGFGVCREKRRDLWYLDSGYSRHMIEDHSLLTEFEFESWPRCGFWR